MNTDVELIQPFIPMWECSVEPWGAKDTESRFIYANKRFCELLNLPRGFDVEGLYDGELPASTSEFQEQFRQHDRACELLRDRVTSFEVHPYEKYQYLQPWFFDKTPLMDSSRTVRGTIFHGRPVEAFLLGKLDKLYMPTSLVFTPPSDIFTKREWELVFYILQHYSRNDISLKLNVSIKTINNYIQNIFSKIGVNTETQLIDYCNEHHYRNYIPQSFFETSESRILK